VSFVVVTLVWLVATVLGIGVIVVVEGARRPARCTARAMPRRAPVSCAAGRPRR